MIQKVFISRSGKANITCPVCEKVKQVDVSKFVHMDKAVTLKVNCPCGHSFSVSLERRLHFRKSVSLRGHTLFNDIKYTLRILDISRMGLKIKTDKPMGVQRGEKLIIDFTLDDATRSQVEKEVIVRKAYGTDLGVEFVTNEHYDKFGPYLLFHFS